MPSFASLLALAAPLMVLGAPLKRDTATNLLVLSESRPVVYLRPIAQSGL